MFLNTCDLWIHKIDSDILTWFHLIDDLLRLDDFLGCVSKRWLFLFLSHRLLRNVSFWILSLFKQLSLLSLPLFLLFALFVSLFLQGLARNLETKLIVLLVDLLLSGVEHLLGLGPQKGLADHSQVWLFLQHIVRNLLLVDDLRDVFHLAGCLHHLDLFLCLLLECRSALFTLLDDLGDVRHKNSDHNL